MDPDFMEEAFGDLYELQYKLDVLEGLEESEAEEYKKIKSFKKNIKSLQKALHYARKAEHHMVKAANRKEKWLDSQKNEE